MKKYFLTFIFVSIFCPLYPMRYLGIHDISDITSNITPYLNPRSLAALCVQAASGFVTKKCIDHQMTRNFFHSSAMALGQNFFWYPYCDYTFIGSKFLGHFLSLFAESKTKDTNRSEFDAMRVSMATGLLVENMFAVGVALYQRDLEKMCQKAGYSLLAALFLSQADLQKIYGSKLQEGKSLCPPEDFINFLNNNKSSKKITISYDLFKKIKQSRRQARPFLGRIIQSIFGWQMFSRSKNPLPVDVAIPEAKWAEKFLPYIRTKAGCEYDEESEYVSVSVLGQLYDLPRQHIESYGVFI